MHDAAEGLIEKAADCLLAGRLVIIPTETVYGLAADAFNISAVEKVFLAKERPSTHPLILHVADVEQASSLTRSWTEQASLLARHFWPGPLTIVLPKSQDVPHAVTGGLDTVAIRVPAIKLTRRLLQAVATPIAAPSANRFTRLSPTSVDNLDPELLQHVAMVLDGGPCDVGIESTVVSLVEQPSVLRLGAISPESISEVIGAPVAVCTTGEAGRAPGQHSKHYSPRAPMVFVDHLSEGAAGLTFGQPTNENQISMPSDPVGYAQQLYSALSELDRMSPNVIEVERIPQTSSWAAISDRLTRAAAD